MVGASVIELATSLSLNINQLRVHLLRASSNLHFILISIRSRKKYTPGDSQTNIIIHPIQHREQNGACRRTAARGASKAIVSSARPPTLNNATHQLKILTISPDVLVANIGIEMATAAIQHGTGGDAGFWRE